MPGGRTRTDDREITNLKEICCQRTSQLTYYALYPIELHRAYSFCGFLRSRGVEPREKSVVNISIYFAVSVPARHAIALPPDAPHVAGLSRLSAVFPAVATLSSSFAYIYYYTKNRFLGREI